MKGKCVCVHVMIYGDLLECVSDWGRLHQSRGVWMLKSAAKVKWNSSNS